MFYCIFVKESFVRIILKKTQTQIHSLKENLFFRATRLKFNKDKSNSIFSVLMVLTLLSLPTFFYATALETDIPPQNQAGIIYVGEGALVYGLSDISNAVVVNIPNPTNTKEAIQPKKKLAGISEQVAKNITSTNQKARKIQAEVSARTKHFYFSPGILDSISGRSSIIHSGELATAVSSSKIASTVKFSPYVIHSFAVCCEKQKFFTSLSFIQFGNFRSASLRAPPIFLI